MKKYLQENIFAINIFVIIVIVLVMVLTFINESEVNDLCVYKIPNHIVFECEAGNSSRVVNYFQITLFEYENYINQGCNLTSQSDEYGFRYELSECDYDQYQIFYKK